MSQASTLPVSGSIVDRATKESLVMGLNLDTPRQSLIRKEVFPCAYAERLEAEYRRYLLLLILFPDERFSPGWHIDQFWHAHILDTRNYARDCELINGAFIHHSPEERDEILVPAYESTLRRYEEVFGEKAPSDIFLPERDTDLTCDKC